MRNAFTVAAVLAISLAWNPGASAQVNEKFADMADEIEMLRSVSQTERKVIVAKAMVLTDQEAAAFWPVYNDYRAAMAKVNDRLVKIITDYAAQRDTLTDAQAQALVNDHIKFEQELLNVRKKHVKKFNKVMPMVKVARFYQIENKLDALQKLALASEIPLTR